MANNSTRRFMVLRFCCAKCGRVLKVSYEADAAQHTHDDETANFVHDGITGADKVEMACSVEPCAFCYGRATEPIRRLREAIKAAEEESEVHNG